MRKKMMTPNFSQTVSFIKDAHSGVNDAGGVPYWKHPYAVAMLLHEIFERVTEDEMIAALLHDVIEDTDYTAENLLDMGYSEEIVATVVTLSTDVPENKSMPYVEKIAELIETGNIGAMMIKYADNVHNSLSSRLVVFPWENAERKTKKYNASKELLVDAMENFGIEVNTDARSYHVS